ncbi:MAG: hypothetical protein ACREUW_07420 [Burkholderiales bacterium]
MLASSRTVYGRTFRVTPVWLWVLQRASGLLLGPLVALHVWVPALASNRALNALLLAIVLAHGYSGLRRMVMTQNRAPAHTAMALLWCVAVAVFGGLLVFARG